MLETIFGATLVNADGRTVPVRQVGEQHVREDLGHIPSFADWARLITPQAWMLRGHSPDEALAVGGDDVALVNDVLSLACPANGTGRSGLRSDRSPRTGGRRMQRYGTDDGVGGGSHSPVNRDHPGTLRTFP